LPNFNEGTGRISITPKMPERVSGKEIQGEHFCGLPRCGLGKLFKNIVEGSVGLVSGHQIQEQRKSGEKSQSDKNKTL